MHKSYKLYVFFRVGEHTAVDINHDISTLYSFFFFNVGKVIFPKSNKPMRSTQEANTRVIGKFL